MNERFRALRAELQLTQQEFADRLHVNRANIAGYETGKRSPSDAVVTLICQEFHVNENWLRDGSGEMFRESDQDIMDMIDRVMAGENEFHKNLFKTFALLDERELNALERIIDKFLEARTDDPAFFDAAEP